MDTEFSRNENLRQELLTGARALAKISLLSQKSDYVALVKIG
jgi:hypothetical protein